MKGVEMRRRIPPELIEKAGKVGPGMPLAFILALALEVSLQGQRMDRRRRNTLRRILYVLVGWESPKSVPERTWSRRYPEVLERIRRGLERLEQGDWDRELPSWILPPSGKPAPDRETLERLRRRAIALARAELPLVVWWMLSPWQDMLRPESLPTDPEIRTAAFDIGLLASFAAAHAWLPEPAFRIARQIRPLLPGVPDPERQTRRQMLASLEAFLLYRWLAVAPPSAAEKASRDLQAAFADLPRHPLWASEAAAWLLLRSLAFVPNDALRETLQELFEEWIGRPHPLLRLEGWTALLRLHLDQEGLLVCSPPVRRGKPKRREAGEAARALESILKRAPDRGALASLPLTRAAIALAMEAGARGDGRKAQVWLDEAARLAGERWDAYHLQQILRLRTFLGPEGGEAWILRIPTPLEPGDQGFWPGSAGFWPIRILEGHAQAL
jgi:hypothetical protein